MDARCPTCAFCRGSLTLVANYTTPPKGETNFGLKPYSRNLMICSHCGHIINKHSYELSSNFYNSAYRESTYGSETETTFKRIMELPVSRSDNRYRVKYINKFTSNLGWKRPSKCLDVGSGLGVFPAVLEEAGWNCIALDPDVNACISIEKLTGVKAIAGDLMKIDNLGSFDLVTYNKVLEHVPSPIPLLARSKYFLKSTGLVYLEVPDGETALKVCGPDREEFFIEHYDAYSRKSLKILVTSAGFCPLSITNVREPSGKFTLRAFIQTMREGS